MQSKILRSTLLIAAMALLLGGCCRQEPLTIAVTKLSPAYQEWLLKADSTLHIINLYEMPVDSAIRVVAKANGLLVTGGEDVYPLYYGREMDTARCDGFDRRRDTLEMACIVTAMAEGLPLFGICRGLQIINVKLGGSLLIDLPADLGPTVTHRCPDPLKCLHMVMIEKESQLHRISGLREAMVNSNHHQGIDRLADGLKGVSFSNDQLIEAIEWISPNGKNFLMAVQWHPERLTEIPAMSEPLARLFIEEAAKAKGRKK
jgi:putative glutamine amidotransferase